MVGTFAIFAPSVIKATAGILLIVGLWTPVVGVLAALTEIWSIFRHSDDYWIADHFCDTCCQSDNDRSWGVVDRRTPLWQEAHGYSRALDSSHPPKVGALGFKSSSQQQKRY